ncbi:1,6-anhydro-N-acetylmuramyl-L-alanine amidase AmpD [Sessilibacter sp. MAH4]
MIDKNGWLLPCEEFQLRAVPSPNFNQRPSNEDISLLVIHNISLPAGNFGTPFVEDLFLNRLEKSADPSFEEIHTLKVSSHLFIRRDGEVIQFVSFCNRAWHAGVSSHLGRENCNDFSIGIELEGTDTEAYTSIQYQVLSIITKKIISAYPQINADNIVGHEHIAAGRKTDPGASFDWPRFKNSVF